MIFSKKICVLLSLILTILDAYGQTGSIKTIEIKSTQLNETRGVEIYLPPSYQVSNNKKYPVMYVLDGQEYFLHPVAYQRMLRFKDKSPEFIVVGVNSDRKKRRKLLYESADSFISFLEKELIPTIDKDYRTLKNSERIYFGWEMAGGLGLEVLSSSPSLFSAYFLASPTHFTKNRILNLNEYLSINEADRPYLHFSRAPEETYLKRSFHRVDSILKAYHYGNKNYKIDNLLEEDHYSTSLKTINNGLRNYFNDYNTLRFYSLKEYDKFGDLNDIKQYYLHRGQRYGISSRVHRTTQHFLLFNAMKEDNFERFQLYANEFSEYFKNLSLEIWVLRFGGYLAQNNKKQKALEIYNVGLSKFSKSAAIYDAIGTLYKNKKEFQKAAVHYKKAIEIAKKNGDKELEKYKLNLEKL
ncbi:alpha/beta hydrolase-fold protein [Flavobacteriaceae bacterium S356]|uniref:Alpha/beta hydrolase-fold protein n=1 Tax=Asprobacillus argus TaxID=3076534 RepID=A0ABU3LBI7_9FLAO|nr:alpha/beta hydrolase-fold protein [Flavobacteriaceae bacterium S356]